MAKGKTTQDKLESILERAKAEGYDQEGLFVTTYEAYCYQTKIMEMLQEDIDKNGTNIAKKNIKGDISVIVNPSVTEYNKASTARNGTAATLSKISQAFSKPTTGKLGEFLE